MHKYKFTKEIRPEGQNWPGGRFCPEINILRKILWILKNALSPTIIGIFLEIQALIYRLGRINSIKQQFNYMKIAVYKRFTLDQHSKNQFYSPQEQHSETSSTWKAGSRKDHKRNSGTTYFWSYLLFPPKNKGGRFYPEGRSCTRFPYFGQQQTNMFWCRAILVMSPYGVAGSQWAIAKPPWLRTTDLRLLPSWSYMEIL
jgi:hypothetical protein